MARSEVAAETKNYRLPHPLRNLRRLRQNHPMIIRIPAGNDALLLIQLRGPLRLRNLFRLVLRRLANAAYSSRTTRSTVGQRSRGCHRSEASCVDCQTSNPHICQHNFMQ